MDIQEIANYVILAGAFFVAIKNIYGFFKKPASAIKSAEENHIKQVIDERVPAMLAAIKTEILNSIGDRFDEVNDTLSEQTEDMKDISDSLRNVKNSQKDVLRIRMNEIYYKYLPYRKIRDSDKQLFDSLYCDYKHLHGNSNWEKMNNTLQTWTVVDDEYKFEQDV